MAFWEQNSSRLKIAKTVFASSRVVCPKRFGNIVEDRPTAWHSGTDSGMQTPATQSKEKSHLFLTYNIHLKFLVKHRNYYLLNITRGIPHRFFQFCIYFSGSILLIWNSNESLALSISRAYRFLIKNEIKHISLVLKFLFNFSGWRELNKTTIKIWHSWFYFIFSWFAAKYLIHEID